MRRFARWWAWEMGRTIETTPVIRLITIERFCKSALLIGGAIALLVAHRRGLVDDLLLRAQIEYNLSESRGLIARAVHLILAELLKLPVDRVVTLALGGLLYGLLEGLEGVGLILRRRWAEYLVLVATAAFVPLELRELALRPSVFKCLALIVNLLIIAYLVWRKRLFWERPAERPAEAGAEVA